MIEMICHFVCRTILLLAFLGFVCDFSVGRSNKTDSTDQDGKCNPSPEITVELRVTVGATITIT